MNTTNFFDSIALIACITTPAYILYYLKYYVKETQTKQSESIVTTQEQVDTLRQSIENIEFEGKRKLSNIDTVISRIESQVKANKSDAESKVQNLFVQLDYVMKNIKDEKVELKQRINNVTYAQERFAGTTYKDIEAIKHQIKEFKNLDKKLEQILNRIHSKDFAIEVIGEFLVKAKAEKQAKEENNAKNGKTSKAENNKTETKEETKPTESVKNKVVNIIKDSKPVEQEVERIKRVRRQKSESKRVIGSRELEIFFKEQTTLTYRGYVIQFGQDAFRREKNLQYKRLYYKKFLKPNTLTQQINEIKQLNK